MVKRTGLAMCVLTMLLVGIFLISSVAVSGAGERKAQKPGQKDKCPVCGMFVAKYPDFLAQVLYKDGAAAYFDGAKDFYKYYFSLKKYAPGRSLSDIDSIYVTDYYTLNPTDGYKAFYVVGSDVYGPMGRELIPFEKEKDAQEFMKDHKGKSILRFNEVTAETIKGLD